MSEIGDVDGHESPRGMYALMGCDMSVEPPRHELAEWGDE